MYGIVTIEQQGRPKLTGFNTVETALYDYLASRMNSNSDKALDRLFTEYVKQSESDSNDGIMLRNEGDLLWYAVPSTFVTPPSPGARSIQGLFIPSENIQVQQLELGHLSLSSGSRFSDKFASFTLGAPTTFFSGVPVSITWTLVLDRTLPE